MIQGLCYTISTESSLGCLSDTLLLPYVMEILYLWFYWTWAPGVHNWGRCWGGPTQPWIWAWVIARLLSPSPLQCPCHQGQLSCFAEEREGPAHLSATAHKGKEQPFLHRLSLPMRGGANSQASMAPGPAPRHCPASSSKCPSCQETGFLPAPPWVKGGASSFAPTTTIILDLFLLTIFSSLANFSGASSS